MNFKHLQYFAQVAKAGSVIAASKQLHLTPQTISGQIQLLESSLGKELFARSGRGLVLTEAGREVLGYADQIFSLGAEIEVALRDQPVRGRQREFRVGVADAIPKSIAFRLLEPALHMVDPVRLICREWRLDNLLAELALHHLDLVISESPIPPGLSVRAFSHRLGSSGISFFATSSLRKRLSGPFPACLGGAPLLLPSEDSSLGQRLQSWFASLSLHPRVVGVFDDSALAKEFGRSGHGVFVAPRVLSSEIESQYSVKSIGSTDEVRAEYFAISIQRRLSHPCVVAITHAAREEFFTDKPAAAGARLASIKSAKALIARHGKS